jgi:hypothetical protein
MVIDEGLYLGCNAISLPHYISCVNIKKFCILPTNCIYVFLTIFRINSYYFSSVFEKETHCLFCAVKTAF